MRLFKMKISVVVLLVVSYVQVECIHLENDSIVRDTLMKVIDSCFADQLDTVIMTPDVIDAFYQSPLSSKPISSVAIDKKFRPTTKKLGFFSGQQRPATFILSTDSEVSMSKMLQLLKSSVWWSIEGMLFVVETSQRGCGAAFEYLNLAWKINLLSAFYVCNQGDEGVMLYTYNPYTNRAPDSWTQVENPKKPDDRWTLYRQSAQKGQVACDTLNFDKLKFLDGYEVKTVLPKRESDEKSPPNTKISDIRGVEKQMRIVESHYFRIILSQLNVTFAIYFDKIGSIIDGKATGIMGSLKNGLYDVSLDANHLNGDLKFIYPFIQGEMKIITQRGKFLRPEEKIREFYSSTVVYLSGAVLLMTLGIMFFYMKRGLAPAALEILRMTLSTSILNPLSRNWIRIYLFGVLHLIIVINATFQGNLAAFLTKPARHNIDTMAELKDHHYQIYVPGDLANMFENWAQFENEYVHIIDDVQCDKYVRDSDSAACINYMTRLLSPAMKYGLHMLDESAAKPYMTYWCRDDWPIGKKLDTLTLRLMQAGLPEYWLKTQNQARFAKMKFAEEQETAPVIRPITLNDLAFSFPILGIGLALATIVFIAEIIVGRDKLLGIKNRRKTNPNNRRSGSSTPSSYFDAEIRVAPRRHHVRPNIAREILKMTQIHCDRPNMTREIIAMAQIHREPDTLAAPMPSTSHYNVNEVAD